MCEALRTCGPDSHRACPVCSRFITVLPPLTPSALPGAPDPALLFCTLKSSFGGKVCVAGAPGTRPVAGGNPCPLEEEGADTGLERLEAVKGEGSWLQSRGGSEGTVQPGHVISSLSGAGASTVSGMRMSPPGTIDRGVLPVANWGDQCPVHTGSGWVTGLKGRGVHWSAQPGLTLPKELPAWVE